VDIGESYPTIVLVLDVHRATSYGTKQATDGAGVVQTSCNVEEISLTPHSGTRVGTVRQHDTAV